MRPALKSDLREVSVGTRAEAEDAVGALLERVFDAVPSAYTNFDNGTTRISVYLEERLALWRQLSLLRNGLAELTSVGLDLGPVQIETRRIRREDWAHSWKKHFRPLEIAGALLIRPSWSKQRARKHQATMVLDPGLSFGTGHHPTTSYCLEQVVAVGQNVRHPTMLDIGTGSGILAIAAAKLGYASPIDALDFDAQAIKVALYNARRNRVSHRTRFQQADLTRTPLYSKKLYDLVCANLIWDLLLQERRRILARLRPGGLLVLAGILRHQFDAVRSAYVASGLTLVTTAIEGEWQSGSFQAFHRLGCGV